MGARSKQKSCFSCVEAKRRCDKNLPSCSRCVDRGIDCTYAAPTARQSTRHSVSVTGDAISDHDVAADGISFTASSSASTGSPHETSASNSALVVVAANSRSGTTGRPRERRVSSDGSLDWFLSPGAWSITYNDPPPSVFFPSPAVFRNFVRGLRAWLVRFLREGHNPFIHRRLYDDDAGGLPRCMQAAFSAVAVAQTATADNELLVDAVSSAHIVDLLASQPDDGGGPLALSLLTTREHLARTQALLVHFLLGLFASSVARRAEAERLIDTLLAWSGQLWDSAALDAAMAPQSLGANPSDVLFRASNIHVVPENADYDADDRLLADLYRAFVFSESVRRTWLLCNIAANLYHSLKAPGPVGVGCSGEIFITARAALWDAPSPARWEAAVARCCSSGAEGNDGEGPLFVQGAQCRALVTRGVRAAAVDEFVRHVCTIMFGIERVENWVLRTGAAGSVVY